jgi:hypothetical protein
VTAAASFTVLQAVDGIALKRAVDAWASAPADREAIAFAAAEAVRWTEIGMNALSYFLLGLTVLLEDGNAAHHLPAAVGDDALEDPQPLPDQHPAYPDVRQSTR